MSASVREQLSDPSFDSSIEEAFDLDVKVVEFGGLADELGGLFSESFVWDEAGYGSVCVVGGV